MTQVTLLIDNDVVIKLAQMDAYGDALGALETPANEVGSLGYMLRYMGKGSSEKRKLFMRDEAGVDRLAAILSGMVEIEPTKEEESTAALIMKCALMNELDLHEGEVGLIAVALHRQSPDIATGDKKALRALPVASQTESALLKLKGRVICFEQIIGRFCTRYGIDRVRLAVQTAPYADETITQAFQNFGSKGAAIFNQLLTFLVDEQIASSAPGWLKSYPK